MYQTDDELPCEITDVVFLLNLNVRRRGTVSWDCDCPFCGGRGKLNVNREKNVYRCNRCGESGGVIGLYASVQNLDFNTACNQIKEYLGKQEQAPAYQTYKKKISEKGEVEHAERASDEELHKTYSTLLSMLTLSETHKNKLLERGFTESQIQKNGYRSTPVFGFRKLTERLIEAGCVVKGVPGFYQEEDGAWSMRFKIKCCGILIPVRTIKGLIVGMQIRLDRPFDHTKYIWLSSINDRMGTSSGSPIHFVGNAQDETIFITEGPLKGDLAQFLSGRTFGCVPGANQYVNLPDFLSKLKQQGVKLIYETYDMDKYLNVICQEDYNEECPVCEFRNEAGKHECLKKILKRTNIQNGCHKLHHICQELSIPCKQFVWDREENGDWAGNLKGVDDWLFDLEQKKKEDQGGEANGTD